MFKPDLSSVLNYFEGEFFKNVFLLLINYVESWKYDTTVF